MHVGQAPSWRVDMILIAQATSTGALTHTQCTHHQAHTQIHRPKCILCCAQDNEEEDGPPPSPPSPSSSPSSACSS